MQTRTLVWERSKSGLSCFANGPRRPCTCGNHYYWHICVVILLLTLPSIPFCCVSFNLLLGYF